MKHQKNNGRTKDFANTWHPLEHLRTISTHKFLVMSYCFRMGLIRQGLLHDLSKYSPVEFLEGAKFWQGDESPNNAARRQNGVSLAWLHHKGRNKHHLEYWTDFYRDCPLMIRGVPIPRRYVAEMIADRISASRVYLGEEYTNASPLQYYLGSEPRMWFVHERTRRDLHFLLEMLAQEGEEQMIRYIRKHYLKGDPLKYRKTS